MVVRLLRHQPTIPPNPCPIPRLPLRLLTPAAAMLLLQAQMRSVGLALALCTGPCIVPHPSDAGETFSRRPMTSHVARPNL